MNKQLLRWTLVIVWLIVIFIGSSVTARNLPEGPKQFSIIIHFMEFFILTSLLLNALNKGISKPIPVLYLFTALLFALFYGFADELHQMYVPGRVPDLMDLGLDTMGGFSACVVYSIVSNWRTQKKNSVKT